jgi:hypothetical protein
LQINWEIKKKKFYELISPAERRERESKRNKQTARGRSTQCSNGIDPITLTIELLLRMFTNLRLADLRLTTAQQRTTGQHLQSDLYFCPPRTQ